MGNCERKSLCGRFQEEQAIDYVFRLLDIPWWYYAIAILLGVVVWRCWRWEGGLLVAYSFLLITETVLIRKPFVGNHFQPELFWSWKAWDVQSSQILTNVMMFVSLGVLAGRLWKWKGMLFAAGLSCGIEILQLVSRRGLCEFDDLFHNCLGAAVGIGFVMLINRLRKREW